MKKENYKLLLGILSIVSALITGLIVNVISDVTDNFEVKERLEALKSDLKTTKIDQPIIIDTIIRKTEDEICFQKIKGFLNDGNVYLGVFNETNKKYDETFSYSLFSIFDFENKKILPNSYRNFKILSDRKALDNKEVDFFYFLLIKDIYSDKSSEIAKSSIFENSNYKSLSIEVDAILFKENVEEMIYYCTITEYGFGKTINSAKKDAFDRVLSNLNK